MAEIDLGNVMGPKGEPGSQWYYGTAITGTNNTGTIFSNSGISKAVINDKYLNTSTSNVYTCTVGGAASAAKWAYIGNIKGEKGNTGATGPTGQVDENTPIEFTEASTEADINSGESLATMFGKIKKSIKTFRSAIGTLSSLTTSAKDTLVNAINELKSNLGKVGELDTTAKTSVVDAVNELKSNYNSLDSSVDSLSDELATKADASALSTKVNTSDIVNNVTTNVAGKVLDARQGKSIYDKLTTHKSSGDHDGRYYTESEMNTKLNAKANNTVVLWSGTVSGKSTTASWSQDNDTFKSITVIGFTNDYDFCSQTLYGTNSSQTLNFSVEHPSSDNSIVYTKIANYTMINKSISLAKSLQVNTSASGIYFNSGTYVYLYRVLGNY